MDSASSWSWVTRTAVVPASRSRPLDVGPDAGAQVRVERGERLVEQDQLRPDGERPGQRDPLLLAAGELVRVAAAEAGQARRRQQLGGAPRRGAPGRASPNPTFAATVRCGNRLPFLRHVADAAALGRQVARRARRRRGRRS